MIEDVSKKYLFNEERYQRFCSCTSLSVWSLVRFSFSNCVADLASCASIFICQLILMWCRLGVCAGHERVSSTDMRWQWNKVEFMTEKNIRESGGFCFCFHAEHNWVSDDSNWSMSDLVVQWWRSAINELSLLYEIDQVLFFVSLSRVAGSSQ